MSKVIADLRVLVTLAVLLSLAQSNLFAATSEPCVGSAQSISHSFESGAAWDLCWEIDSQLGLVLSNLDYTTPDRIQRQVMEDMHIAGLLIHYDDSPIAFDAVTEHGLGGARSEALSAANCRGEVLVNHRNEPLLCKEHYYQNTLTRYATADVLQRNALSLTSHANIGSQIWSISFELTEDGTIIPSSTLSGHINRYTQSAETGSIINMAGVLPRFATNATIISVWRLDFNIDNTASNDVVDEVQFNSDQSIGVRRRIAIERLSTETRRQVAAERFRGWRISDNDLSAATESEGVTRVGYYLDPQSAGYRYSSNRYNWAQYQFFVTDNNRCERTVINNRQRYPECGDTLDEFIGDSFSPNSATITDPVLWHAVTSRFVPHSGDWPAINSRKTLFKLLPFDWTVQSPFESNLATGQ